MSHLPLPDQGTAWALQEGDSEIVIFSLVEAQKGTLTFPSVVTAANTVEEYGAQATSPTAEFRS